MTEAGIPSWFNTPDIMQAIIVLLFSGFIWFAVRTLKQVDENQKLLSEKLTKLEKDFYTLRGEHHAFHTRDIKER